MTSTTQRRALLSLLPEQDIVTTSTGERTPAYGAWARLGRAIGPVPAYGTGDPVYVNGERIAEHYRGKAVSVRTLGLWASKLGREESLRKVVDTAT